MLLELRESLRERLEVVADRDLFTRDPTAHLEKLKAAALRLNGLVDRLPPDTNPELRHFLERQSYVKALAWLDARSS